MKKLKQKKSRGYHKHRKSIKYVSIDEQYKTAKKNAKYKFYKDTIKDLKQPEPGQWYSKLKRLCSYDENKSEQIN